jgi:hypothetical protein
MIASTHGRQVGRTVATWSVRCWLAASVALAGGPELVAQSPEDVTRLLDSAARAEPKEALEHLTKAVEMLGASKALPREQRAALTARLAKIMQEKIASPRELARVLGPAVQKQLVRQVLYRRYLEHWLVESPVRLWIVVAGVRGEDPVIRSIQAWAGEPP